MSGTRLRVAGALLAAAATAAIFTASGGRVPASRLRPAVVRVGRLELRTVRSGRGTPVVLLHGFGESLTAWRSVFTQLSENADVIALDLPGHGLSSKPASGYATDSLAADVGGALDAMGVGRAVLVGHSLGGAVAAAVALRAPDRVLGLVLVDPAIAVASSLLPDSSTGPSATEALRAAIAEYEVQRSRFNSVHDRGWLRETDSELAYVPAGDPAYGPALRAVLSEFDFHYITPERARQLDVPVLLIWGSLDPLLPVEGGRRLAAELPRARLAIIPRCWHRPHVERPDTVAALVAAFVERTARATP